MLMTRCGCSGDTPRRNNNHKQGFWPSGICFLEIPSSNVQICAKTYATIQDLQFDAKPLNRYSFDILLIFFETHPESTQHSIFVDEI